MYQDLIEELFETASQDCENPDAGMIATMLGMGQVDYELEVKLSSESNTMTIITNALKGL